MKLADFSNNIYSQWGEDGIIQKIFEIIPSNKTCIEFGAWDGLKFSNTANLFINNNWKAILIESDIDKYKQLLDNTSNYNCSCINNYVTKDNVNDIINQKDLDLLSIDIDGDEYYILENLQIKPKLIICEYNPTIPSHIEIIPKENNSLGCSILALKNLSEKKGYKIISITDTNCFLIREDFFSLFNEYDTNFESLIINKYITYFISDYKGNYALSRSPVYGYRYFMQQSIKKGNLWIH